MFIHKFTGISFIRGKILFSGEKDGGGELCGKEMEKSGKALS